MNVHIISNGCFILNNYIVKFFREFKTIQFIRKKYKSLFVQKLDLISVFAVCFFNMFSHFQINNCNWFLTYNKIYL